MLTGTRLMPRMKLPDRRPAATVRVPVDLDGGPSMSLLVTLGFRDPPPARPYEVFCADFKAGTALHTIVMDSCILLSRLLQHGDHPDELLQSLSRPPSLIGAIAKAVADFPRGDEGADLCAADPPPDLSRPPAPSAAAAQAMGYTGDPCPECKNTTMTRNGTCLKCCTCGATTGCS